LLFAYRDKKVVSVLCVFRAPLVVTTSAHCLNRKWFCKKFDAMEFAVELKVARNLQKEVLDKKKMNHQYLNGLK
jgi:hypothetical protein